MTPPDDLGPDGATAAQPDAWIDGDRWSSMYHRLGPLRYSDLGRRRLSPTADPAVLAKWLAGAADRWWAAKGRPDPFTLVVVSGDDGRLASAVLDAGPECAPALRYVLVHPDHADPGSPPASMAMSLPLENPAFLYPAAPAPAGGFDADDEAERPPAQGIGPMVTLLADLPGLGDGGTASAVVAVEFLSRLPFDAYVLDDAGHWSEVRLVLGRDGFTEIEAPLDAPPNGVDTSPGAGRRVRWTGALHWLRKVLASADTATFAAVEAELPETLVAAVGLAPVATDDVGPRRAVEWQVG